MQSIIKSTTSFQESVTSDTLFSTSMVEDDNVTAVEKLVENYAPLQVFHEDYSKLKPSEK